MILLGRVALTVAYTFACGALLAAQNTDAGASTEFGVAVFFGAPVVGFAVGRWWVLVAVAGALVGRTIGWDSSMNDGNPALWWPYALSTVVFFGIPLCAGMLLSYAVQAWQRPAEE